VWGLRVEDIKGVIVYLDSLLPVVAIQYLPSIFVTFQIALFCSCIATVGEYNSFISYGCDKNKYFSDSKILKGSFEPEIHLILKYSTGRMCMSVQ
jgi:hypothetical protein